MGEILQLTATNPGGQVFLASLVVLVGATIHDMFKPWPGWAKLTVTVVAMAGVFASMLMPIPIR